jgi:cytoskeleton protein RodZ
MSSVGGVGDLLRAERQRRGWTLADAEIYLKIRRSMLEAIEQGRFELLPGRAYAMAFARTYAEFLGLDAEEVVRRCRAELRGAGAPEASGGHGVGFLGDIDVPRMGMAAVAVVGVLVAGLWMFGGGDPGERRVEPLAQQPMPTQEPAISESPRLPAPSAAASNVAPGPGAAMATPPPAPPRPAASPQSAPADPSAALAAPFNLPPAQPSPPPAASSRVATAQPAASRISIKANGDTWVEIRDASGASVLARVLRNGETFNVPDRPGLVLSSGRLRTMEVRVDGQVIAPHTRPARRDLALDPARLLQNAQAPSAEPPPPPQPRQQQRRGAQPGGTQPSGAPGAAAPGAATAPASPGN